MKRRSTKEPVLKPGHPFDPVLQQLRAQVAAFKLTTPSGPDQADYLLGKQEGLEDAITLLTREEIGRAHV